MRRSKDMSELLRDEKFAFHVGQLMGAAEMVAHWMTIQEDPMTKQMGGRLGQAVNWFFTEDTKAGKENGGWEVGK